jgi:hypothetical protein
MTPRRLFVVLAVYLVALLASSLSIYTHFRLHPASVELIESVWQKGVLVRRSEHAGGTGALADDEQRVIERVVGEAPILNAPELVLAISLVPGRDGLLARLGDRIVLLTPDDLLSRQIYDHGRKIKGFEIPLGFDTVAVKSLLAERLATSPDGIFDRVELRRLRTERSRADPALASQADALAPELLRTAALATAQHIARGVSPEGRFRYMIDAPSAQTLPGYSWPRHGGSTYFLAQATGRWPDPAIKSAAQRAAALLIADVVDCGEHRCIARGAVADLGDSAIALFALIELIRSGTDPSLTPLATDLARFVKSQQRPDGEFMHRFNRTTRQPVDVQTPYVTGEAALGLLRMYKLTHDPSDLAGASAALARLVGPNWRFFGDRYYFGEEHWTCQVMAELWADAPDREALTFCLRWAAFNRALQLRAGETPYDADGSHGFGPLVTPRLPPVASRAEAAIATFDIARRVGIDPSELAALEAQIRRALSLLLRHQFRPGPTHLFVSSSEVYGAIPGSEVDWQVRIDYMRHASGAMLRWLELTETTSPAPAREGL